jgi:hypothetical protein
LDLAQKEKENAVQLAQATIKNELQELIAKKDRELAELRAQKELELTQKITQKENELIQLQSKIETAELNKKLAVNEATQKVEKERDELKSQLNIKETEKALLEKSLNEQFTSKLQEKEAIIRMKDEEIEMRKDLKMKMSTKMLGETLEQHCEMEFNKLRATAFQKAYFEKDNDARTGSKGDFIYREMDDAGNEIISIMFEMKNEGDETATKKKNEDFFKELDKDRTEKKCEYAVLVTMLEAENEYYNTGIVDVSHRYEKMYVVRPNFFIPIITLLRNAAMNSLQYKAELAMVRSQNIDISNFEDKINAFKEGFARNYELASRKFNTAIEEIDKTILHLQKTKTNNNKVTIQRQPFIEKCSFSSNSERIRKNLTLYSSNCVYLELLIASMTSERAFSYSLLSIKNSQYPVRIIEYTTGASSLDIARLSIKYCSANPFFPR